MTEKEKIRAEIERRYNEYMAKDSELAAIRADECLDVLSFIDSMQKEPVSEDLEQEIERWSKEQCYNDSEKRAFAVVARQFANWQREQMMEHAKTGEVTPDYEVAMDDGLWIDLDPQMHLTPALDVKPGDRIKILFVKED